MGQYAIQIALLYSFTVITTCSPKSFDLVKSLGATHVFDYNTPDVADRIREVAPGLQYVFDTIGRGNTSAISSQAAEPHATLCTVRPGKANIENVPESVKVTDVLVWTAFLKDHSYGTFSWPVSSTSTEASVFFFYLFSLTSTIARILTVHDHRQTKQIINFALTSMTNYPNGYPRGR